MLIENLGKRIYTLRKAKGYSQEQLANMADIPINQVGRIERAEINASISTISFIADALEISLNELLTFNNDV